MRDRGLANERDDIQSLPYLSASLSHICPAWIATLERPVVQSHLIKIDHLLQQRRQQGCTIYPARELIFHALYYRSPADISVVILGQDPYHGVGQAMGLAFSVPDSVAVPPSLRNIYRELSVDLGMVPPRSGNLVRWACQGVLLLNSVLTVEANSAASHDKLGWENVTDAIIDAVNDDSPGCVFLLWGNWAQRKSKRINTSRHQILKAAHPSALSAHRGFFGCRHFSQTNAWLIAHSKAPIKWDPTV